MALIKSICLTSGRLGTKGSFSPKRTSPLADNVRFKSVYWDAVVVVSFVFNTKNNVSSCFSDTVASMLNPALYCLLPISWNDVGFIECTRDSLTRISKYTLSILLGLYAIVNVVRTIPFTLVFTESWEDEKPLVVNVLKGDTEDWYVNSLIFPYLSWVLSPLNLILRPIFPDNWVLPPVNCSLDTPSPVKLILYLSYNFCESFLVKRGIIILFMTVSLSAGKLNVTPLCSWILSKIHFTVTTGWYHTFGSSELNP